MSYKLDQFDDLPRDQHAPTATGAAETEIQKTDRVAAAVAKAVEEAAVATAAKAASQKDKSFERKRDIEESDAPVATGFNLTDDPKLASAVETNLQQVRKKAAVDAAAAINSNQSAAAIKAAVERAAA